MTMDKNMKLAKKETMVMCHNTIQSMHKNNAFIFLGKHHSVFYPVRPQCQHRSVTMFVFWWGILSLWPHVTSSEVRWWRCVSVCKSQWVSHGWPCIHRWRVLVFLSTCLAPTCRHRQVNRH